MTVETRPFRTTCPVGRKQSEPCPCQPRQTVVEQCNACLCEWQERAALIADGCRLTQQQAEKLATEQIKEALDMAERKQRRLF